MRTQSTTVVVVKIPVHSNSASVMGEALDTVRTAIEPTPQGWGMPNDLLKATNDNDRAWPLVPFPKGWYAAS
jgi:hypothetical protein